jgi:hypothetical protein
MSATWSCTFAAVEGWNALSGVARCNVVVKENLSWEDLDVSLALTHVVEETAHPPFLPVGKSHTLKGVEIHGFEEGGGKVAFAVSGKSRPPKNTCFFCSWERGKVNWKIILKMPWSCLGLVLVLSWSCLGLGLGRVLVLSWSFIPIRA